MQIYFHLHIELNVNSVPIYSSHGMLIIRWNSLDFPLRNRNIERGILAQESFLDWLWLVYIHIVVVVVVAVAEASPVSMDKCSVVESSMACKHSGTNHINIGQ